MTRVFTIALMCACFSLALSPVSVAATEVDDERASAFVAGASKPDESFAPKEGMVLLALAGLAVLVCFSLVMYSITIHARCKTELDTIDAQLRTEGDPHV